MKIDLMAQPYEAEKKGDVKRLRRDGKIPGILYGHKDKPHRLYITDKDFKKVLDVMKKEAVTINLTLNDKSYICLIKAIQHNPITNQLLHIDFQHIQKKEKIQVNIPIHAHGEAPGIKDGGVLDQHLHEVMVKCLPDDIPSFIDVDVSGLKLGDTIHIKDIQARIPNVEFEVKPETSIISVLIPKVEKEVPKPVAEGEVAPVEGEVPAEGEVAAGEKGKEEKGKEEKGKEEKGKEKGKEEKGKEKGKEEAKPARETPPKGK
jgi:large subunit ribosomal protein L25